MATAQIEISAEDRKRERDPWRDLPTPPGSREAAAAAELLRIAQATKRHPPRRKATR
jgi:hypothetical protein